MRKKPEHSNVKPRSIPDSVKVVSREDWKARHATGEMLPLQVPLHSIILTWTDTEPCIMPDECEQRVRDVQKAHMDKGLPDIQYNFLVGGDKLIYEGRGFNHEPPRYPEETIDNAYLINGKCIEIAFIEKHLTYPNRTLTEAVAGFICVQRVLNRIIRPVYTKGLKDNKFVAFCKLLPKRYHEPLKVPPVDMVNKVADFLAIKMIDRIVIEPIGIKGIKDNKIVRFSDLMADQFKEYNRIDGIRILPPGSDPSD